MLKLTTLRASGTWNGSNCRGSLKQKIRQAAIKVNVAQSDTSAFMWDL